MQKSLQKGSGWIIDSVIDHTNSISKYSFLAEGSYIKLPKELDHPRKRLFNNLNIDENECFEQCLVRYLNRADHNPRKITKADKDFEKILAFKDIIFPIKIRDIHKIEKKNSIGINVFDYGNNKKYSISVSKQCYEETNIGLLLIEEGHKALCYCQRFQ